MTFIGNIVKCSNFRPHFDDFSFLDRVKRFFSFLHNIYGLLTPSKVFYFYFSGVTCLELVSTAQNPISHDDHVTLANHSNEDDVYWKHGFNAPDVVIAVKELQKVKVTIIFLA